MPAFVLAKSLTSNVLQYVAYAIGIVPVVWLAVRRSRNGAHWGLAAVFGVSFLADSLHWLVQWPVSSLVYPISQATILTAILRDRETAAWTLLCLSTLGLITSVGLPKPDWLVHIAAWGWMVWLVWPLWPLGLLRGSLLVTFGLGLVAWLVVAWHITWATWGVYQATRLAGTLLFCRAVTQERPRLAVA